MRVIGICLLLVQLTYASRIYEGDQFALQLDGDGHFVLYPKEQAKILKFSGAYHERHDSLILTTYQVDGEKVILAIFIQNELQLLQAYAQSGFYKMLPKNLYISKELHPNGSPKKEYYWEDFNSGTYQVNTFNPKKWIQSIAFFEKYLKQGKQLIFFDNALGVIQTELHYNEGKLSGKCYHYKPVDASYLQVELVQIEVYREGELKKSKKPEAPPVFYTSHF